MLLFPTIVKLFSNVCDYNVCTDQRIRRTNGILMTYVIYSENIITNNMYIMLAAPYGGGGGGTPVHLFSASYPSRGRSSNRPKPLHVSSPSDALVQYAGRGRYNYYSSGFIIVVIKNCSF